MVSAVSQLPNLNPVTLQPHVGAGFHKDKLVGPLGFPTVRCRVNHQRRLASTALLHYTAQLAQLHEEWWPMTTTDTCKQYQGLD